MISRPFLLGALTLSLAVPASAQSTDPIVLDPVVVTSTRLEQTTREAGSSVTVITAEEIKAGGYDFAMDALAAAPGVTISTNGAFGGTAKVRIRGASTGQTLVLIDGIPVNDPTSTDGGFDFSRVDARNIERIEILKGPQSTIWGSHAIGGVVSIITKRASRDSRGTIFGEYGSFDTLRAGVTAENASDASDLRVQAVLAESEGISKADEKDGNSENDSYESQSLSVKGGFDLEGGGRFDLQTQYSKAEFEVDGFPPPNFQFGDTEDEGATEEISGAATLSKPSLDGRLENVALLGLSNVERTDASWQSEGLRRVYRYQGTYSLNDLVTIGFGAERETQSTKSDIASIKRDSVSTDSLHTLGVYKPHSALTLTGGLRRSSHQRSGSEITARTAAAWDTTDFLTLRASWGQGFKAPSIFQSTFFSLFSFDPMASCAGAPNTELKAERSVGIDFGADIRFASGRGQGSVTYFQQDTEDSINWDGAMCNYQNISEVESSGMEIQGSLRLIRWLTASASLAFISAEDESGKDLLEVPDRTGLLMLRMHPRGPWTGSAALRHNGEEQAFGGLVNKAWTRLDIAATYSIGDSAEVYLRVENLFDADYQQVLGYGTPGRSGKLGLRVRY